MTGVRGPRDGWKRWSAGHPVAADALRGLAVAGTGWLTAGEAQDALNAADVRTGLLCGASAVLLVPLRRRVPLVAASALLAVAVAGWVLGDTWTLSVLAAAGALAGRGGRAGDRGGAARGTGAGGITAVRRGGSAVWAAGAVLVMLAVTVLRNAPTGDLGALVVGAVVLLLGWAWGSVQLLRRRDEEELARRARALAELRVRVAVADERRQMAAELHDVVSHTVTVMVNLLDGAVSARERAPADAWRAVERAGETGRSAVRELTDLLGVLRAPDGAQPMTPAVEPLTAVADRVRTGASRST